RPGPAPERAHRHRRHQPGAQCAQARGGFPCRGLDLSFHHRGTWYGLPAAGVPGMAYRGRQMKDSDPGTLTVAATPLGQPADASPRLAAALAAAQLIAAEDTRRVLRLARELGVRLTGRLISYYNGVDKEKSAEFLAALKAGTDVLLIAEAGMPRVSDPGYRLGGAAADAGITGTGLPRAPPGARAAPGAGAAPGRVLLAGLPAARGRPTGTPVRRAGRRAADHGVLRVTPPGRGHPRRAGRRARAGPAGGRLPRADQDARGSSPGHARRAGRLGGTRRARRDHP